MQLIVKPEYAELVSPLRDDQYNTLKKSIKENGLWMPIITNPQGVILDGHHRHKICTELNIPLKHAIREFKNEIDEIIFVGESNMARRQMSDIENIELVIKLEPYYKEQAKQNQGTRTDLTSDPPIVKNDTREALAEKAGVSHGTYDKGKKILQNLPEGIIDKLKTGGTTINKEYQKLQKDEKKEERHQEIRKTQINLPDKVMLYNKPFQDVPLIDGSVSLIFTDPPYHDKFLHLFKDLAIQAAKVLRDGGSLVTYVGQGNIGKIINMMEEQGLKFWWPLSIRNSGPSASVFGKKILVGSKIMLWFVKGKYEGEFVTDTLQSEFQGKELHEWAQSSVESDYYIKYMTIENEIIYDPFLGQGTFGVSAITQNRQFIGCEISKEHFDTASRLLSVIDHTSNENIS